MSEESSDESIFLEECRNALNNNAVSQDDYASFLNYASYDDLPESLQRAFAQTICPVSASTECIDLLATKDNVYTAASNVPALCEATLELVPELGWTMSPTTMVPSIAPTGQTAMAPTVTPAGQPTMAPTIALTIQQTTNPSRASAPSIALMSQPTTNHPSEAPVAAGGAIAPPPPPPTAAPMLRGNPPPLSNDDNNGNNQGLSPAVVIGVAAAASLIVLGLALRCFCRCNAGSKNGSAALDPVLTGDESVSSEDSHCMEEEQDHSSGDDGDDDDSRNQDINCSSSSGNSSSSSESEDTDVSARWPSMNSPNSTRSWSKRSVSTAFPTPSKTTPQYDPNWTPNTQASFRDHNWMRPTPRSTANLSRCRAPEPSGVETNIASTSSTTAVSVLKGTLESSQELSHSPNASSSTPSDRYAVRDVSVSPQWKRYTKHTNEDIDEDKQIEKKERTSVKPPTVANKPTVDTNDASDLRSTRSAGSYGSRSSGRWSLGSGRLSRASSTGSGSRRGGSRSFSSPRFSYPARLDATDSVVAPGNKDWFQTSKLSFGSKRPEKVCTSLNIDLSEDNPVLVRKRFQHKSAAKHRPIFTFEDQDTSDTTMASDKAPVDPNEGSSALSAQRLREATTAQQPTTAKRSAPLAHSNRAILSKRSNQNEGTTSRLQTRDRLGKLTQPRSVRFELDRQPIHVPGMDENERSGR